MVAPPGWLRRAPGRVEPTTFKAIILAAGVALPALVLAVGAAGSGWRPVGLDHALELLRTWEVGGDHTPLTGAYSRYGWDHPGPLLFVASAPAVRLLGPEGMLATAGLVNAFAAGGAVVAAHRTAGLPLAVPTAVGVSVMVHALTGAGLTDPWNPYVAALPFVAYLLCVWGAVHGDRVLLVAAVVAGSWCVQAHVGYLPITLGAALVGAGLRWARRRARTRAGADDRVPRRWVAAAGAIGLVLWLPPLVDQVAGGPGNLGDLYAFARDGTNPAGLDAEPVGWSPAVETMSGMVTPPAPWTRPGLPHQYLSVPEGRPAAAVVILGMAVVGGLAWWRRRRGPAAPLGLSGALVAVSVVAMARAGDDLFGYLIRWSWGVAALVWIAAAWALIELVAPAGRATRLLPALSTVAVLVVGVLGFRTVADGTSDRFTGNPAVGAVTGLSRQLRAELDPDTTYELVAASNWHYLVAPGIAVDLITHGQDLVVSRDLARTFKPWWVAADGEAPPARTFKPWWVAADGEAPPQVVLLPATDVPAWRIQHPTARRVAVHLPRTPAERAERVTGVPREAWLLESSRRAR